MNAEVIGVLTMPGHPWYRLAMTRDDALWMARAVAGEEGTDATAREARAVVATLLRRHAVVSVTRGEGRILWPTLTDLIRAYAQPVNPDWENRGDPRHIARRARIRALRWEEISTAIRGAVMDIMTGKRAASDMAPAVHWAAYEMFDRYAGATIHARVAKRLESEGGRYVDQTPEGNVFASTGASRRHKNPRVEGGTAGRTATVAVVGGVVCTVAALLLLGS